MISLPPCTLLWVWDDHAVQRREEENDNEAPEGRRRAGHDCDALGGVPRMSLLLALFRPLRLRRIFPIECQLGLDSRLHVPRDYFPGG